MRFPAYRAASLKIDCLEKKDQDKVPAMTLEPNVAASLNNLKTRQNKFTIFINSLAVFRN
jgi:hypothetical protein